MPNSNPPSRKADILYTADLHGSRALYGETLAMAGQLGALALILGGDLAPHATVPEQRLFFREFLVPLLLEYRQEQVSADIYFILGNDDWRATLPVLLDSGIERFHYIHRVVRPLLRAARIAGLCSVTLTPFLLKDWERWEEGIAPPTRMDGYRSDDDGSVRPFDFRGVEREERISLDLDAIDGALEPTGGPLVCVFHAPPHGTALDQIQGGAHVGSREIRRFLEARRPVLSLHGHIHESPAVSGRFADRLGPTICVNPGQRMGSALHAVWFGLEDPAGSLTHSLLGPATLDDSSS